MPWEGMGKAFLCEIERQYHFYRYYVSFADTSAACVARLRRARQIRVGLPCKTYSLQVHSKHPYKLARGG